MMGRMDTELRTCPDCKGSGKDPKKRSRRCPGCRVPGRADFCKTCGDRMPCRGTDPGMCDQTFCNLKAT